MRFWEYQRATDYYQQKAARLRPQQPAPQPAPAQDITPYQPSSPAPQPQAGNSALPAWAAQPFAQQQTAPTNQFGLTQYTQPTPLEQQNLYGPQLVAQEQAVQQQLGYDPYNTWLNREGRLTPGSALMGLMNIGTQSVGIPLLGAITAGLAPGQQVDTSGGLADIYKQWQAIEHARAPAFNIPAGPLNINEKWISENFLADPFFWTGIGATAMAGKAATAGAKAAELGGEATEAGLKMLQQAARWKKAADVVQTAENITSPLSWPGTAGRGLRALSQGGGILQDLGEESAEQFARSGARIPNLTREALLTMPAAQRAMALSGIDEQLAASAPYALGGNLPLWAVNKMAESPALRTAADVAGRGLGALGFATTFQPRIAQAGVTGAMGLVQGLSGGIPKMLGREVPQTLDEVVAAFGETVGPRLFAEGPEAVARAWARKGIGQIASSPFKAVGGSLVGELGDITGLDRLRARTAANQVGREALGAEAGAADLGALAPTPAEEERRLAAARAAGGFLWKNAKPQFKGMTVGIMPPDIDDGALTSDFANPLQKTRIKPYDWAWVDKNGNWATLDENGQRRELLTRGDEDTAGAAAGEEIERLHL